MANKITFEFVADDGDIKKGFVNIESQAKKTSAKISSSFKGTFAGIGADLKGLGSSLTSFKTMALGFVAALGVKQAIGSILEAAAVQEDAINQLNSSLIASGKYSEEASQGLQDYASELQSVTRYGDETTLQTMALIQSLGNLSEDSLKDATAATMDMASALKIDLQTAALLVGKAAAGETGSLSRYGLVVEKGATQAQTFANALTAINTKFGGSAQRDVLTYSGATQQLSNTWGDIFETLGQAITENSAVIKITKELTTAFQVFGNYVKSNIPAIQSIIASGISSLFEFGLSLGDVFNWIIKGITRTITAFRLWKEAISKEIETVGNAAIFIKDVFQYGFGNAVENFKTNMKETSASIKEDFFGILENQQGNEAFSQNIDAFLEKARGFSDNVKAISQETITSVTDTAKNTVAVSKEAVAATMASTVDTVDKMSDKLNDIVKQGIVNGVGGGIQSLVKALYDGENAFEAFGKFLFGVLGDIAIQLGTTIIASSKAIAALKAAVISPFGGAAVTGIAAGIALVALGALLKSMSGGAATPSSGSTVPTTGENAETSTGVYPSVTEESTKESAPGIQIVIQGNVLDNKETGLALVKTINQALKDQGLSLSS